MPTKHTLKLLDLFCGAGGAAMGYYRAGFKDITGIDNRPMPRYPFKFIQADALEYLEKHGHEYDVIHASPPCQAYARIGCVHNVRKNHADLVGQTREFLLKIGKPWVIENVPDSKLPNAITLCGSMFKLGSVGALDGVYRQLRRHRLFQIDPPLLMIPDCQHKGEPIGVYGRGGPQRATRNRGYMGGTRERIEAMGIDWMTRDELSQAIPPAYTEYIGKRILEAINAD